MEKLSYNDLKDKYFYRTEKWDWLNETMIHLFDSTRPRMVTMDPWPQEIYLDAVGDKTVKAYIESFVHRYPKGEVPTGLEDTIIEVLNGLAVEEHFVKFSDTPVTLDETILKPLRNQGIVNMLGAWEGHYTYNIPEEYKDDRTQEVTFIIKITNVQGQTFTGTVEDDQETGGTPGTGQITGGFTDHELWFDKNMPIYSYIDQQGNRVRDPRKKHPTIRYQAQFGPGKQACVGTWRFKKKVLVWRGIIPYWGIPGTGEFTMKKVRD